MNPKTCDISVKNLWRSWGNFKTRKVARAWALGAMVSNRIAPAKILPKSRPNPQPMPHPNPTAHGEAAEAERAFAKPSAVAFAVLALSMGGLIACSNFLVAFSINEFLTWAVFSYPLTFLVVDIANRNYGLKFAAKITAVGFLVGTPLSFLLAEPRIAAASITAYLAGQTLDIFVFHKLRRKVYKAYLASSVLASLVDGLLFFALAFAYTEVPWGPLWAGDTSVKILMVVLALPLLRLVLQATAPKLQAHA